MEGAAACNVRGSIPAICRTSNGELSVDCCRSVYNQDGRVDAADYTVWRDRLGSNAALPNESATLGRVTAEDYTAWRANFGAVASVELVIFNGVVKYSALASGAAAATPVPEPASAAIAAVLLSFGAILRVRIQR